MDKCMTFVCGLLAGMVVVALCIVLSYHVSGPWPKIEYKDSLRFDTLHYYYPVPASDSVRGHDMVTVPVAHKSRREEAQMLNRVSRLQPAYSDTIRQPKPSKDSMTIELAIVQRRYEDSLYTAVVSGYRLGEYPRLEYIHVRQRTEYLTKYVKTVNGKRKPWSIGLGVGYGIAGRTFTPYIGLGVQYKILEF